MEELKGEQGLEACKKAFSLTDRLWTVLIQGTTDDTLKLLYDNGEWFSINQMLLPHTFVENWLSIIINLRSIKRQDEALKGIPNGSALDKKIEQIGNKEKFVKQLVKDMDKVLRKESGLKEVNIKTPDDKEKGYKPQQCS
jgi:hypothetical protein